MDELLMADVGPDDNFDSNVLPFVGNGEKRSKSSIADKEEELEQKIATSREAGRRKVSTFMEVLEDNEQLKFLIEGILPDTGLLYIGGLSGTGKTILATQIVADIILGTPMLAWQLGEGSEEVRAMMLSLEMPKKELQLRLLHMYPRLTKEEQEKLNDNFLIYTEPEPFNLWDPVHIADLIRIIGFYDINLLLIDSASVSFAQSLKDDTQVNESIKNLLMIRVRLDVAMIVVSHTRKPPPGIVSNPEDVTLNELFGHSGVAQSASSILIMLEDEKARKETIRQGRASKTEKKVHIVNAKSRFGANSGAFSSLLSAESDVEAGEPLRFRRNVIPIAPTEEQKKRAKAYKSKPTDPMADFDFTSLMGDDE